MLCMDNLTICVEDGNLEVRYKGELIDCGLLANSDGKFFYKSDDIEGLVKYAFSDRELDPHEKEYIAHNVERTLVERGLFGGI